MDVAGATANTVGTTAGGHPADEHVRSGCSAAAGWADHAGPGWLAGILPHGDARWRGRHGRRHDDVRRGLDICREHGDQRRRDLRALLDLPAASLAWQRCRPLQLWAGLRPLPALRSVRSVRPPASPGLLPAAAGPLRRRLPALSDAPLRAPLQPLRHADPRRVLRPHGNQMRPTASMPIVTQAAPATSRIAPARTMSAKGTRPEP